MSIQLTTGILQQIKNRGSVGGEFLLDGISNIALAYSKYKLLSTATKSVRISNTSLAESDINFDGIQWDETQIDTHASGALATVAELVDQSGNYGSLINITKSLQPLITDANGLALPYINNSAANGMSLWNQNTANLPALDNDYVCAFISGNDIGDLPNRSTFNIRKTATENINILIIKSGSDYLIEYIENTSLAGASFTHGYVYTPANVNDLFAVTLRRINGVVTLYINGTAVTWGSGTQTGSFNVFLGVSIARRVSSLSQSRRFNYQTLLLFTGANLSGFNIADFNTKLKALHGIA